MNFLSFAFVLVPVFGNPQLPKIPIMVLFDVLSGVSLAQIVMAARILLHIPLQKSLMVISHHPFLGVTEMVFVWVCSDST